MLPVSILSERGRADAVFPGKTLQPKSPNLMRSDQSSKIGRNSQMPLHHPERALTTVTSGANDQPWEPASFASLAHNVAVVVQASTSGTSLSKAFFFCTVFICFCMGGAAFSFLQPKPPESRRLSPIRYHLSRASATKTLWRGSGGSTESRTVDIG